ncbi:MAG: valine--tRNA ligase [Planctomycetaceae bacterium]
MTDLPKQYHPADVQQKWFQYWEAHGVFNADPPPNVTSGTGKPPHTIMIPLPNVTGALHMGHALNSTCQDIINRWRRMQGYEALWMPGTDHAGIATQAVVERRMLEEEGLTRHDIGREALVNRIWTWKDAYEKRILNQLKSLGASCDWRRTRFTLDDVCSKAVRRTFFKMFRDGLIYRGKRLVNWDVHLQTAVANDEVFEEEIDGHFWTFNYPVVDDNGNDTDELIHFSTTRPETMLGDTAVCVHPSDERYTHLVGKRVRIPLNNRLIPIIADGLLADPEKGTGAVKVTPGHDQHDYACYQRNPEIGIIDLFHFDGTLNEHGGEWEGQDRLKVRDAVIERMAELGRYKGVEDRKIPMKHSDRSKTPVETLRSDQWFVKMGPHETPDGKQVDLAQSAMDAVTDGRVTFFPSRYEKTYLDWLGEKRDWCISRQLWWGHRIPVWTVQICPADGEVWSTESGEGIENSFENAITQLTDYLKTIGLSDDDFSIIRGDNFQLLCCFIEDTAGEAISNLVRFRQSFSPAESSTTKHPTAMNSVPGYKDNDAVTSAALNAKNIFRIEQDPDVLDTWFSSALWPHATLGWPDLEHDPPLDEEEVAKQTAVPPEVTDYDIEPGNRVLKYFYPHAEPADGNQSVLITSRDIITLWVARMVLTGLYNMDEIPFRHVHVHPKILDGFGQTMSKSKGNGVDPVDLIAKYGSDAIRFTIASFAGETQDVRLPISYECPECETLIPQTHEHQKAKPNEGRKPTVHCPKCKADFQYTSPNYDPDPDVPVARMVSERFEYGRNFCNKLWNAARFAMMNLEDYQPLSEPIAVEQLPLEDRWILSRLATVAGQLDDHLSKYQYDAATRAIRDFTWNEFCDWYLEMIKSRLRDDNAKPVAQSVLVTVLDSLLRFLQPLTPFLCAELWERLGELAPSRGLPEAVPAESSAIIAKWPSLPEDWQDASLEQRFERLQETIIAIRNVRAVYNIPPSTKLPLHVRCSPEIADDLENVAAQFDNLAKVEIAATGPDVERPAASAGFSLGEADGYIPLEGIIDRDAELKRQQKEADKLRKHISGHEGKLKNEKFVNNAPADVVANVRETLAGLKSQLESVEQIIADLGGESLDRN